MKNWKAATILYKAIHLGNKLHIYGCSTKCIIDTMTDTIQTEPLAKIDYISVVDARLCKPVQEGTAPVLVAMAIYIGPNTTY